MPQVHVNFSDDLYKLVTELREEGGFSTFSAALRYAVKLGIERTEPEDLVKIKAALIEGEIIATGKLAKAMMTTLDNIRTELYAGREKLTGPS